MILIDRLHRYFQREFNLCELDSIKLRYSLEIIIGEVSKFIILIVLFWISSKVIDFIYCSSVLLVIRLFTGGLHFETYGRCLIFSCICSFLSPFFIKIKLTYIIPKEIVAMVTIFFKAPFISMFQYNNMDTNKTNIFNIIYLNTLLSIRTYLYR
ncbi:accessory gene regulator B family protein [Tissierella carlieri]|uniref:accessory gene regulator B family protein n=1 Tax=Tissierella carlieri TaxID=689904 RepID=UPI001C116D28|nr:accessory gene regulator B family protein [Tissierella carlieri]